MNEKTAERIKQHYEKAFGQTNGSTLRNRMDEEMRIDAYLFPPSPRYPFWKMCTVGASDYRMPKREGIRYGPTASLYNEYMIFMDPTMKVAPQTSEWQWYWQILVQAAYFPYREKQCVAAEDVVDLGRDADEMQGVTLLFPEVIEDTSILQCKTGLGKTVTFLQVMPVSKREIVARNDRMEKDPDWLYCRFYRHEGGKNDTYIARRYRDDFC